MDSSMLHATSPRNPKTPNTSTKARSGPMKALVMKQLEAEGFTVLEGMRVDESGKHSFEFVLSESPEEFSKHAKLLGAAVVFLECDYLEESEFLFEDPDAEDDQPTDLRDIEPDLKKYEQYLGTCRSLILTITTSASIIRCSQFADWSEEFEDDLQRAWDKANESSEAADIARMQANQDRQERTIKAIHALRNDDDVRDLALAPKTSQATIMSFVRIKVPDATHLPPAVLKAEATLLRDSIITSSKRK